MNIRRIVFASPAFLVACASASSPSSSQDPSPSPENLAASTVVHLSAVPGKSTALSIQVVPDAECTMPGISPPPRILASARGVARFVATVPAAGSQLALVCTRPDGTEDSYALDVAPSPQDQEPVTTNVVESTLPAAVLRPAFEGDPLSLSDAEIVSRGFPPPPTRDASSPAYARWLARTREPSTFLKPHHGRARARRESVGQPATDLRLLPSLLPSILPTRSPPSPTTDTAWSGYIATPDDRIARTRNTVWEVTGEWDVPSVTATAQSSMGQWVGLGGWYDTGLIQAGTAGQTGTGLRGAQVQSYNAFYEYWTGGDDYPHYLSSNPSWQRWYPSDPATEWTFPVNAGDSYQVTVWAGDSRGNLDVTGGYGWYFIDAHPAPTSANPYPAAEVYIGSLPAPATSEPFEGATAEWIIERSSSGQLPNFGATQITDANAYGPNSYTQTPGDLQPATISALVNANGTPLDRATTGSSSVSFTWIAPD